MSEAILRREAMDRSKIAELSKASSAEAGVAFHKNSRVQMTYGMSTN